MLIMIIAGQVQFIVQIRPVILHGANLSGFETTQVVHDRKRSICPSRSIANIGQDAILVARRPLTP